MVSHDLSVCRQRVASGRRQAEQALDLGSVPNDRFGPLPKIMRAILCTKYQFSDITEIIPICP